MHDFWPHLEMSRPEWLAVFLALPILIWWYRRSLVDLPKRQLRCSLIVRSGILALLVLALSGINLLRPTRQLFVVFAVDHSLSVDESARETAVSFVQQATKNVGSDSWAWFPFAASPGAVRTRQDLKAESPRSDDEALSAGTSPHSSLDPLRWRSNTNLQEVIEAAAAVVPADAVPRLVLLSDGNETTGNARQAAAAAGIPILTVPMQPRMAPEIQVSKVDVPEQVAAGEPFRIEVVVDANHADNVRIEVYRGDRRIVSESRIVQPGENRFVFTEQVDQPTEFTATISRVSNQDRTDDESDLSFRDTILDNNQASGLVFTTARPRVLLIEGVPELAQHLQWAMDAEGIDLVTRTRDNMPDSLAELQEFELLMISNVAATDLTPGQMDMIRTYVADLGGGFIMLGSDRSFGLGGYYRTAVEEVLPVRSDFEKENEKPGLGMVLIIDRSGSMGGPKIELAKDAARGAVELLGNKDQIGVLVFDGTPAWISELQPLTDKAAVIGRIASIRADGGTALYPAMQTAFDALRSTPARLKHVIILTDGYSTPGDFDDITAQMAAARITVSTVGIGDADQQLLERIAQLGSGRYYFTDDPGSIPQIFARETIAAGKSAISEVPFLPQMIRSTTVLDGVDMESAPFLLGYVVTRPKPTSEVILVTETGDPLLSWWRYGLGMAAAFTSDVSGRWSAEWTAWDGYGRFWAQLIRHCMRDPGSKGITIQVRQGEGTAVVQVDAVDALGQFVNGAFIEITIIDPELTRRVKRLPQTAPGRYETTIATDAAGAWTIQLAVQVDGAFVNQQSRGFVVGDPDELRMKPQNLTLLRNLASMTGGTMQPVPESVFLTDEDQTVDSIIPLRPWLLSVAVLLFVIDVLLRRIEMPRLFGTER
jgi:Ca-activated chloride channel homolog